MIAEHYRLAEGFMAREFASRMRKFGIKYAQLTRRPSRFATPSSPSAARRSFDAVLENGMARVFASPRLLANRPTLAEYIRTTKAAKVIGNLDAWKSHAKVRGREVQKERRWTVNRQQAGAVRPPPPFLSARTFAVLAAWCLCVESSARDRSWLSFMLLQGNSRTRPTGQCPVRCPCGLRPKTPKPQNPKTPLN